MKTLRVKGKVATGSEKGAKFLELPWVKKQIIQKLGFKPYPGTLNIKLIESDVKFKEFLKKAKPTEILPEEGFCRGKCFNAYFMQKIKCAIVVPEIANYLENIMEIVAPINLRENFNLKDGDIVEVEFLP